MHSAKTDALLYLLGGLLEHLEEHEPGILQELQDDIDADEAHLRDEARPVSNRAHTEAMLEEARLLLEQARSR